MAYRPGRILCSATGHVEVIGYGWGLGFLLFKAGLCVAYEDMVGVVVGSIY